MTKFTKAKAPNKMETQVNMKIDPIGSQISILLFKSAIKM